ncbi:MAG: SCO family protein [Bdellovibrionales bacterium]
MTATAILLSSLIVMIFSFNIGAEDHQHHHDDQSAKPALQAAYSDSSLYNSETQWRDQTGKKVTLKEFRGKKIVVAMAYTHCTYTCPLTVAKLKKIESELIAKGISNYRIVLASFDPKRDTPERLASFMKKRGLDFGRWTWLSPQSDKDVREMAVLLGVAYSKDKSGEYSHSNIFALLNEKGDIIERINGINADHKDFVEKLSSHANEK